MNKLNPIEHPICLSKPNRITDITAWHEHIPFAMFLVDILHPKCIVELGTHKGDSYCAFCQAVKEFDHDTRCFAIDSWEGDPQAGYYGPTVLSELKIHHDPLYSQFSTLVQSTFDEALNQFDDGTIDLLHIDGYHAYESVKHDFETWLPKLNSKGIVLFHDTNVMSEGYGARQYFNELKNKYPNFEFLHGHGLGIIAVKSIPHNLQALFAADNVEIEEIRRFFSELGHRISESISIQVEKDKQISNLNNLIQANKAQMTDLNTALSSRESRINELDTSIQANELQITELNNTLRSRESRINELDAAIQANESQITDLNDTLRARELRINELNNALQTKDAQINNLQIQLQQIQHEILIQLRNRYQKVVEKLLRQGTRRRRLYQLGLKGIKIILNEGWRSFWFKFRQRLRYRHLNKQNKQVVTNSIISSDHTMNGLYALPELAQDKFHPKVSVVVPNYNHSRYLRQRLESIYRQTYKNFEVILLDDASNDESVKILEEYQKLYPYITRYCFNDKNSGGVFYQWNRGFEMARGELIWIAESDDYCSYNMLEELVKHFVNEAVMLAFCRTVFVDDNTSKQIWSHEEYLSDIVDSALWRQIFIKSAHQLVNMAWAVKNIIPNVSSSVFRNPGKLEVLRNEKWKQMRICGDWLFYLNIIRGGLVAYTPNATNYFRMHQNNTSVEIHKQDVYYREHEIIAEELIKLFQLKEGILERQQHVLEVDWRSNHNDYSKSTFKDCYNLERIKHFSENRKPNLLMITYALAAGGGETFPIKLANLLKSAGYGVTLLNCHHEPTEPGIRKMLREDIPLLELDAVYHLSTIVDDMGVEIVHSHHSVIDLNVCTLLENNTNCKIVVTTHGSYELLPSSEINRITPLLKKRVDKFVYAAEKNLEPFNSSSINRNRFVKIGNALGDIPINPIPRQELGINKDDFVLCLVSRAIPEKGWQEGIEAVKLARKLSGKAIHLLLIGEGPEYSRLKSEISDTFIHFLGFKANIRDYFALSDMGFLPSRFHGESFPLVIIDCLQSNRPVLASDIGEIAKMLKTDSGMAGNVYPLDQWKIPVNLVADLIVQCVTNNELYSEYLRQVPTAVKKFDIHIMLHNYEMVYHEVLGDKINEIFKYLSYYNIIINMKNRYQRVIDRILRPGTRRRGYYELGIKALRIILNEGWRSFWHQFRQRRQKGAPVQYHEIKINTSNLKKLPDFEENTSEIVNKKVSIIIPTRNAGPDFDYTLEKIRNQKGVREIEIIVVDSGSVDRTIEFARGRGARVLTIQPDKFNHGLTRNYGAEQSSGDYYLFMVQDAIPVGDYWLYNMVVVLESDEKIGAATCRQIPRSDADLFACASSWNHYRMLEFSEDRIAWPDIQFDKLTPIQKRKVAGIEDVCGLIRSDVFNQLKFKNISFAEDLDLGVRIIKAGYGIAYLYSNGIIHSHNRSPYYSLKRYYVDSKFLSVILDYDPGDGFTGDSISNIIGYIAALYTALVRSVNSLEAFDQKPAEIISRLKQLINANSPVSSLEFREILSQDDDFGKLLESLVTHAGTLEFKSNEAIISLYCSLLDNFELYLRSYPSLSDKPDEFITALYQYLAVAAGSILANHYLYQSNSGEIDDRFSAVDKILSQGV